MSGRQTKKRPRNNTVPIGTLEVEIHHQPMTSRTAEGEQSNLLRLLEESCNNHFGYHGKKNREYICCKNEKDMPKKCQEELKLIREILPKIENKYRAAEAGHAGPAPMDVNHLCSFYKNALSGGFCSHAPHLFRAGKGGTDGKESLNFHKHQNCR